MEDCEKQAEPFPAPFTYIDLLLESGIERITRDSNIKPVLLE